MKKTNLAVPFFFAGANGTPTIYMIPVAIAHDGTGRAVNVMSQTDLRSLGFWNRPILVGETLVVKTYSTNPQSIADVAKRYGNPRHKNGERERVVFLQTTTEFQWLVMQGTARHWIRTAWSAYNVDSRDYAKLLSIFTNEMSTSKKQVLLRASNVLAEAFYSAGHITKSMLAFHLKASGDAQFLMRLDDESEELITAIQRSLFALDNQDPKRARKLRTLIRQAVVTPETVKKAAAKDTTNFLLAGENGKRLTESVAELKAGKTADVPLVTPAELATAGRKVLATKAVKKPAAKKAPKKAVSQIDETHPRTDSDAIS